MSASPPFADAIVQAGGKATQIEWAPPADGDRAAGLALARLVNDADVEAANRRAFASYLDAQPVLAGIGLARESIPGMNARRILHSGPPIAVGAHVRAQCKGAIIGAIAVRGLGDGRARGGALGAESGDVAFAPCHHHGAVGPMAGVISPSMPVWIVRDPASGRQTFSNLNEGSARCCGLAPTVLRSSSRLTLDGKYALPRTRSRVGRNRRHRAQATDRAGAEHGRRGSQPERRRHFAAPAPPRAGDAALAGRAERT